MRVARILALVVSLGGGAAGAQEKMENPTYASWAKHKVGTAITLKSTTTSTMFSSETLIGMKLVEVTGEKVVIETTGKSKVAGMEVELPPMKQDHLKTIELPKGAKKEDLAAGKPAGTTKEGTETVKVGGQDVKTKWYEYEVKTKDSAMTAKMWMSDDVPGSLVKMETKVLTPLAADTKMELVEIKKP